jgi:hypothetical protein
MDIIVAAALQLEGYAEGEVSCGAGVEVEDEHLGRLRHDGLNLDGVDQGLRKGCCL